MGTGSQSRWALDSISCCPCGERFRHAGQLTRAAITGGPPQQMFTTVMYGTPRCVAGPPGLCAVAEPARGKESGSCLRLSILWRAPGRGVGG